MNMRAGIAAAALTLAAITGGIAPAHAQELSEKAVKTFMDYAWSLTPQQFSKPDGSVVQIDKSRRQDVMVPLDVAREVIKAGRLSAHAQVCDLRDDMISNHRALMRREISKKIWSPQQEVYISQLHLTTVMLLTGKIKLVEKEGDKEVIVDETKQPKQTCTEEQRAKVKEMIVAYVAASPKTFGDAPTTTSTPAPAGEKPGATTPAVQPE